MLYQAVYAIVALDEQACYIVRMKRWVVYAVAVLAAVAAAAWLSPAVEVRPTLAVVETRVGAAAVQWPRGVVSVWLWNDAGEVRLWPLG